MPATALDLTHTPDWADLVAAALLGTERRPPTLPAASGALAQRLERLDPAADAEAALLSASALVGLYRRAGWLPAATSATPFPLAPADDRPVCSPQAAWHLAQMLAGKHTVALPEWLAALAAHQQTPPPELLPVLLSYGHTRAGMRAAIIPVLGTRGRWLASLNPEWDYALLGDQTLSDAEITTLWETGSHAVRVALLAQVRSRNPAQARDLLITTWSSERADERLALLKTLAEGLSMADEPFLEQVLDDRSERVRKAAAALLAELPASRLVQRMVDRLTPLLHWTPGVGPRLPGVGQIKKPSLEVRLPEECDAAMQRDGIVLKPVSKKLGERAWWLNQMLEVVPPAVWAAAWGAVPQEILAAKISREWRGLLVGSWAEAARRSHDLTWLEVLVDLAQNGEKALSLEELLPALPPARREALVLALLKGGEALHGESPVLALLRMLPAPWSYALSRALLKVLGQRLRQMNAQDWHLRAALEIFAQRIPADLAAEAIAQITNEMRELPYWGASISEFEELLAFRDEMLRALS
ncbi:DUF5691 domain-containing protein [Candidatus Oscillochloris fontis]|uniref:DUF5691 domain-containing protein n=1 Tax=Candidatus Oscillochloris fontis TaxID=2496868 RepID=UPI00101B659A|nr:DUF5691 domain-containing protein [Candidatus Oscillochloris fontis]